VALIKSIRLHRALNESSPPINQDAMGLVKTLEQVVPVLGPPAIFVRLKVNHPVVTKIVVENLNRVLSSILVDKRDIEREEVRRCILRNMHRGQNWSYVDFGPQHQFTQRADAVDTSGGLVVEGNRLEDALRMSLEQSDQGGEVAGNGGEKRKRNLDECADNIKRRAKRIKVDLDDKTGARDFNNDKGDAEDDDEEDNEDEDYDENNKEESKSIYIPEELTNKEFPTILELLSIDHPVVMELLKNKCQVDASLVVPQFDEFLHHPSLLESSQLVVGCDSDGKVAGVRPATFSQGGGAVLGYIETPNMVMSRYSQQVVFWGGRDIRDKWPQFAKQLEKLDLEKAQTPSITQKVNKMNMPVAVVDPKTESSRRENPLRERQSSSQQNSSSAGLFTSVAGPSSSVEPSSSSAGPSSSSVVTDLMALLAARGVSVQKN